MKKVLLIAAVASLAMTSCKKDYTCECTVSSTMPNYPTQTTSGSTGKMKKSDAESKCNEGDSEVSSGTYKITSECSIK